MLRVLRRTAKLGELDGEPSMSTSLRGVAHALPIPDVHQHPMLVQNRKLPKRSTHLIQQQALIYLYIYTSDRHLAMWQPRVSLSCRRVDISISRQTSPTRNCFSCVLRPGIRSLQHFVSDLQRILKWHRGWCLGHIEHLSWTHATSTYQFHHCASSTQVSCLTCPSWMSMILQENEPCF